MIPVSIASASRSPISDTGDADDVPLGFPQLPLGLAADDVLVTGPQLRAILGGVSEMCIWRWIRDPNVALPRPFKINGRNYWRRQVIRTWLTQRMGRADGGAGKAMATP